MDMVQLTRWDPFREIDNLQREVNQLFETFPTLERRSRNNYTFAPAAELHETSDAVQLKLEVPGIDPKDLDIQATAESVSISGERKSEETSEDGGIHRSEFYYGKFQRVIPLPCRIQNNNIEANYKDGVLHLNLPKAEEEKNKVVKVDIKS
jgi:HSP20 family protein|nr:Hsp20/alpha crystallin family protein [Geitlerinema sp. PCC 9228]